MRSPSIAGLTAPWGRPLLLRPSLAVGRQSWDRCAAPCSTPVALLFRSCAISGPTGTAASGRCGPVLGAPFQLAGMCEKDCSEPAGLRLDRSALCADFSPARLPPHTPQSCCIARQRLPRPLRRATVRLPLPVSPGGPTAPAHADPTPCDGPGRRRAAPAQAGGPGRRRAAAARRASST